MEKPGEGSDVGVVAFPDNRGASRAEAAKALGHSPPDMFQKAPNKRTASFVVTVGFLEDVF